MCRIFYNPSHLLNFDLVDLNEFLSLLEKSMGGDGNGIYMFNNDEVIKSLEPMDWYWLYSEIDIITGAFIFHTRRATHGLKKVYNAQPFVDKQYIVAHNGIFGYQIGRKTLKKLFDVDDKYSDSYLIYKIIKEKGIFKFYNAFIKDKYGVVLVHDKLTKITYLLKTGGSFQVAKLKSGKHIYGSSELEYWNVEWIKDLDDGMYILRNDGYTRIHKPPTPEYAYWGSSYGTSTTPSSYSNGLKDYKKWKKKKKKKSKKKKKKKKKHNNHAKWMNDTDYSNADSIIGIEALFDDPPSDDKYDEYEEYDDEHNDGDYLDEEYYDEYEAQHYKYYGDYYR